MAFAESIDKIKSNLIEINPTFIFAVPRIFEKVYTFVVISLESSKYKAKAFHWALHIGKRVCRTYRDNQRISAQDLLAYEFAKRVILKKVKGAFGNRLRFCVSGGAAINKTISEFFEVCGVLILEGYGLTETTAAICVNTPFNYKFGSVGLPIGDVQLKIAEDGEILVKSKKVMTGYYKNPEATKEAFDGGWFKTGDIGAFISPSLSSLLCRKSYRHSCVNGCGSCSYERWPGDFTVRARGRAGHQEAIIGAAQRSRHGEPRGLRGLRPALLHARAGERSPGYPAGHGDRHCLGPLGLHSLQPA